MRTEEPGAPFKLVGGHLCFDFINTVGGRQSNPAARGQDFADLVIRDRLTDWSDLARWASLSGASALSQPVLERAGRAEPAQASRIFGRARALRAALFRIFTATIKGWDAPPVDLELLNQEVARARMHQQLAPDGGRYSFTWTEERSLERILWPVVLSAVEVMTTADPTRITACPGDECGWMFLDTTRNHSRRWCDMADCGNLAKVRRFRENA